MKVLFPRLLSLLRILAPPPLFSILSCLKGASFNLVLQKIKEFEALEKVLAQAWSSGLLFGRESKNPKFRGKEPTRLTSIALIAALFACEPGID